MREIKFRAWDKIEKRFISQNCDGYFPTITLQGTPFTFEGMTTGFKVLKNLEIMQYTGLKDKNGKEIYEGDIVQESVGKTIVEYGIQEIDAFEGMGWNLWSFPRLIGQSGAKTRLFRR